ncbi:MAG: hypothetical protein JXB34_05830 [Bacteroidales bacterium]|nr:hypothetical protein [Bacteroidales bacterium]
MEKPDKYYKETEQKFDSGKPAEIIGALNDMRINGKASVMPLVFRLLEQNPAKEITDEIFTLLSQLKNKECVPHIIGALQSGRLEKYNTQLITTCWQSGLDYSEHIIVFAEHFIKGGYQTAIEAFSVIEEWIFESHHETVSECKKFLIGAMDKVSAEKKPLYIELVKVVESHM